MSNRKDRKDAKAARRNMKQMRGSILARPEIAEQINTYRGITFGIDHSAGPDETRYYCRDGMTVHPLTAEQYEQIVAALRAEELREIASRLACGPALLAVGNFPR